MGIKGAILGDIMGSKWEFEPNIKNPDTVNLWGKNSFFTDDTVMSCAVKYAIDTYTPFEEAFKVVATPHIDEGIRCWGGNMYNWVKGRTAYNNSWANGSAMRVSYVAECAKFVSDVLTIATESALPTHASTDGILAAQVTALCAYYARTSGKEKMKEVCDLAYPFFADKDMEWYKNNYFRTLYCPESVALAVRCVYESADFESCMRNVIKVDDDTDTIGSIAGGIAEELYGCTVEDEESILRNFLSKDLLDIVYRK